MTTLNSKSKRWTAKVRWYYRSLVRSKQKQKVDDNYILESNFPSHPKEPLRKQEQHNPTAATKKEARKNNSNTNVKNATNLDPTTKIFTQTQNQPVTFGIFRNDGER